MSCNTETINVIEQTLSDIWSQALDLASVELDDDFFDLGGHSLMALAVIDQIKQRLGWKIPLSYFISNPTIRGLVSNASHPSAVNGERIIIRMSKRGRRKPIVFVPALSGLIFPYGKLARQLSENRACYALQSPVFLGSQPEPSIEKLATVYAEAIKRELGHEDVDLVGWSFGGLVAFEIIRILGEPRSRRLVLLDSHFRENQFELINGSDRKLLFANDIRAQLGLESIPDGSDQTDVSDLVDLMFSQNGSSDKEHYLSFLSRAFAAYDANLNTLSNYSPKPQEIPTMLLHTERNDTLDAWRKLIPGHVQFAKSEGGHYGLMVDSQSAQISNSIERFFNAV